MASRRTEQMQGGEHSRRARRVVQVNHGLPEEVTPQNSDATGMSRKDFEDIMKDIMSSLDGIERDVCQIKEQNEANAKTLSAHDKSIESLNQRVSRLENSKGTTPAPAKDAPAPAKDAPASAKDAPVATVPAPAKPCCDTASASGSRYCVTVTVHDSSGDRSATVKF